MARLLYRSRPIARNRSGARIHLRPQAVGWKWIDFSVRRLGTGSSWSATTGAMEACLVLLAGQLEISWQREQDGEGRVESALLGPRQSVFCGYPSAMYLSPATRFRVRADAPCEFADCRAKIGRPTRGNGTPALVPRVIRPEDCGFEIRGGGNATRQIIDIVPPSFPAGRLMICEVLTPGGNWSSYPPHKHDRENPPIEADLDEIYYFRFRDPDGYGFQRLYTARRDETVKVEDGDVVAVREGYHPFVTAYGHDAYYLNVLAGVRRSMAATDDPRYAAFRQTWPAPDPRLPLVPKPVR